MPEFQEPDLEALADLDRLLEHRIRLAVCVLLVRGEEITFSWFKEQLGETDGSIGANLQRLEEAGYIRSNKEFAERRPVTWYAITPDGRRALTRHLAAFDALTRDAVSG